jgi:HemY protein
MMKYIIAVVIAMAAVLGLLLYIGDSSQLQIISTSPRDWLNKDISLSSRMAVVIGLLTLLGLAVLWSFLSFLFRLPGRLKSGLGLRKRNQALDAMEDALLAGAEGDAGKARKKAERARALVGSEALGRIISAQSAEACGDSEEAITHYRAMLKDEKTAPTGRRGLAQQLMSIGDTAGAMELSESVYAEDKNARWAFDVLFNAQVTEGLWERAADTVARAERRKHIDKDVSRRRRAVLLTAQADKLTDAGESPKAALDLALDAASDAPDFAPGVALAARLLLKSGNEKRAGQIIEKAWARRPHPALALAYRDVLSDASPKARAKRLNGLAKSNTAHRESTLLLAEEALLNGDGVAAWSALDPLVSEDNPSARVCQLAYRAETMLKNPTDAGVWLERAATAKAEADWSDLDPSGEAFDYSDPDWRRLVFSFGDTGELIHPRFESGAVRRAAMSGGSPKSHATKASPPQTAPTPKPALDNVTPRQPDDPGVVGEVADDLADRLDSLLGDKKSL